MKLSAVNFWEDLIHIDLRKKKQVGESSEVNADIDLVKEKQVGQSELMMSENLENSFQRKRVDQIKTHIHSFRNSGSVFVSLAYTVQLESMFHSNTGEGFDTDGSTLAAGLLTTAAILSDYPGHQLRRGITAYITACIAASRFISFKETTYYNDENDQLQSSSSSSPLINYEIQTNSSQQEASDTNNLVPEDIGFLNSRPRSYNSFSSRSSRDQETCSSSNDIVMTEYPVDQGLGSSLSTQSQHVIIDILSQNEEQLQHRNKVAQIVKESDLISLKDFGGVEKVASIFGSDLESGIRSSIQEPEVRNSYRDKPPSHTKEFVFFLLKAGNNYTIFLLVLSAGLSFGTEIIEEGSKYGWLDGVVILAAFCQARKLEKERNRLNVTVVRGQKQVITISNLVAGDIVCLEKGDLIPADGLIVRNDGLELDGVLNSKIDHDRNPFLFFGSRVMEGHGDMLATSVADQTELAELLIRDPIEKTLLEAQIEKINTFVENLSLSVSIFIAFVALLRLLFRRHIGVDNEFPELKGKVSVDMLMKIFQKIMLKPQGKVSILASALTVVVIAIQHGMPLVITISLSCWNSKVFKNQAEPQNLSACATMGIVSVICIDATGGLVCNSLEVSHFYIGGKDLKDDTDSEIDPAVTNALEQVMRGISASHLAPAISAIPTNDSLISWANSRWGMDREFVDQNLPILVNRKLSSNKSCCGILTKNNGGDEEILHTHWSGAASTILNMCSHYYDSNGRNDLVALAVKLEQIRNLETPEKMKEMTELTVIGSSVAEEKLLLVQCMQQKGDLVAFFGGSLISNTPALKTADIGITEDTSSTMASESSDIIIKAKADRLHFWFTDNLSHDYDFERISDNSTSIDLGELDYIHSRWPNDGCALKETISTIPFRYSNSLFRVHILHCIIQLQSIYRQDSSLRCSAGRELILPGHNTIRT
ncbi:hypothetical protein Ddye_015833 [Dipteronia dyeriana]|uniref:P-type ATPase A domain-containing protein n=1 Tax=Dipteronia dyeriana TaxID=168575 RepID=A0AAD9WYA1_9ROSI|nr:hypothetical protein Ddye_015833 [Dipteronia dyeriana]